MIRKTEKTMGREEKGLKRRWEVVRDKGIHSRDRDKKKKHYQQVVRLWRDNCSHFNDTLWEHLSYPLELWLADRLLLVASGPLSLYIALHSTLWEFPQEGGLWEAVSQWPGLCHLQGLPKSVATSVFLSLMEFIH